MIFEFGNFELDTSLFELRLDGVAVHNEPQTFHLLPFLIEHRNRTITKDDIVGEIWDGRIVTDAAVCSGSQDDRRIPRGQWPSHPQGVCAVCGTVSADRQERSKACWTCKFKRRCTSANHRVVDRCEHEHVLEEAQRQLDENPNGMRTRRETVEHPFVTIKARMGATHFLMKRLKNVKTETALAVLAYNLTRVMNIIGIAPLMRAIRA
ncbi:MAG: transposase [Pseudomonadota bacterium]